MNNSEKTRQPLVIIQRNPMSGSGRGRGELKKLIVHLRHLGFHVRMFSNRARLDQHLATGLTNRDLRCIVAAGGDGTVADLVNRHPGVAIAILPLGTENLLARYIGVRRCGRRLAQMIDRGRIRVLDSAMANGRRVLLMLSAGIDAEIVQAVHSARTSNIYRHRYVGPTLRAFFSNQPRVFTAIASDGSASISGSHLIVTNVPRYGFEIPFAPNAKPDDGLLDVRAFHGTTRWQVFWHAFSLRIGLPIPDTDVTRFSAASVTIHCEEETRPALTQCDGDPGPLLPLSIEIVPRSLLLIVP